MRLAVISDIHGNILALEAVLADLAGRDVDLLVNLGDCLSGPLWPRETFDRLKAMNLPTVRGNHDRIVGLDARDTMGPSDAFARDVLTPSECAELAAHPFSQAFAPGVVGFHASPHHDDRYVLDDIVEGRLCRAAMDKVTRRLGKVSARVILIGHSHRPDMMRLSDGTLLINPGSVGDPGYEDLTGRRHVSEAGTPHARYALLDMSCSESLPDVTFRAIPYDVERAARRADENGRPDWAHALRTGFMPPGHRV